MGRLFLPVLFACALTAACDSRTQVQSTVDADVAVVRAWLDDQTPSPAIPVDRSSQPIAPVGHLIDGLRTRLEQQPNDLPGWRLLAQSYAHVGDMTNARLAAERAIDIGADADEMSATLRKAFRENSR